MKRFVTYLYECERGNKSKNVGFIRVNIRNTKTDMQICIRNSLRANDVGKIYVFVYKKDLLGIELGELKILNSQCDGSVVFEAENIMGSGHTVSEIVGVGIRLQNGGYFASCWQDEFAEAILRGAFSIEEDMRHSKHEVDRIIEVTDTAEIETFLAVAEETQELQEQQMELEVSQAEHIEESTIHYEKIDLSKIRDLPSPNWHLTTNSFLVHGFWNYGYLVLKKEMAEDKERLSLGVPGIFEKPEMVMAILFGFTEFEEIPSEMVEVEMNVEKSFPYKKKNQEPKVGLFGSWFVELKN